MKSQYDKAYKISFDTIKDCKYFYLHQLEGMITQFENYGLIIDQDAIEAAKTAILDHFNGGVEMEWEKESHWKFWEEIEPSWFVKGRNDNLVCSKQISDFE